MVREKCVLDFSSQMALIPQILLRGKGVPQGVRKLWGIFLDYLPLILIRLPPCRFQNRAPFLKI